MEGRHDEIARNWAMEDVISKSIYVYGRIGRLSEELKASSTCAWAPEVFIRHFHLLREWLAVSERLASIASEVVVESGRIEGRDELQANLPRALAEIHSPKLVTIDSDGYAFEPTGERSILPGLNLEQVRRRVDDSCAGRTRSLKEVFAGRVEDGI
jgi:hypothetical protein